MMASISFITARNSQHICSAAALFVMFSSLAKDSDNSINDCGSICLTPFSFSNADMGIILND
ncbi:MAG: hypothetical protein LBL13_13520 [Bacteroidales bacterium]|nr:hypothetical protein [Bacteroidales bacterium]